MEALQVVASAAQIVSSMVGAVRALQEASAALEEAPRRVQSLEAFASELEELTRHVKQKHCHKLHSSRLEQQIQSLTGLVQRLHPNIRKMRMMVSKNKMKNKAKIFWYSVAGDPLSRLIDSVHADLNGWLQLQTISENVQRAIDFTAESAPPMHRIHVEQGYPESSKCHQVRRLLEQEGSRRVILIVGLSGIGKSCLARQVASDPPKAFVHGAAELCFGQWCSRAASHGSKAEYHKRLSKKLCGLLVKLGFMDAREVPNLDLEGVCCKLQTALAGKSILLLLDDVWEQDIVERFTKLYDNRCKYLVTTRNEGVYEITEAEKVEICKDDVMEMSKEILLYHTLLTREELPAVAEALLDRCGHHPLTVAVMGKALRKETSTDKWKKAISNLSTYATCAPGPVSYVNEKEAENTVTIFGSFEFSLQDMPEVSRRLFMILAAISWAEPVPDVCLEVLWSALGVETIFPLAVSKLVEGSLLIKTDLGYHVHDMVALYLESKVNGAVETLLTGSSVKAAAAVAPWLFVFGKDEVKNCAEEKMEQLISLSHEEEAVVALESMVQALMASKSISELEASRKSFSSMVGPRVANFVSSGSPGTVAALAKVIRDLFAKEDYYEFAHALENTEALDKLLRLLTNCRDPTTKISLFHLVAKLAEHGSYRTISKVLVDVPMDHLAKLLSPDAEEWHDCVFGTITSFINAGKSEAVQMMVESGIDRGLIDLLEQGSEVAQHHAIVALKAFYKMGGPLGCFQAGQLNLLPWHARHSLERFVLSDRSAAVSPKPQTVEETFEKIVDGGHRQILKAMQDLVPIIEKAGIPRIREMILRSILVESLADMLRNVSSDQDKVESAFLLTKLACSGGEEVVQKLLDHGVVSELVKMMNSQVADVQDSAYTALHQMLICGGDNKVLKQILKPGQMEKLVQSLSGRSLKTRELSMLLILDLVEMGNKPCVERMFALQVVEKFVGLEKSGGVFSGVLVNLLKGLDKCKNLSAAERRVMRQQVDRKVKASIKGHKIESSIVAAVEDYLSDGSWGSSGSSSRRPKR